MKEFNSSFHIRPFSSFVSDRGFLGISLDQVYIKDERYHPTGTHKDRSFEVWIPELQKKGVTQAVISSSGNSAISAAYYTRGTGIHLTVFVSIALSEDKRKRLLAVTHDFVTIRESKTAKKDAFQFARDTGAYFLRSSTDELAVLGYKSIGHELADAFPRIGGVVIPTSSGTTAKGVYQGLLEKGMTTGIMPKFFIVQTGSVHPIAEEFDSGAFFPEESLATSIVDLVAHRKKQIVDIVSTTRGTGVIVSNADLKSAQDMLHKEGRNFGWESVMTLAALPKILLPSGDFPIVCLATS